MVKKANVEIILDGKESALTVEPEMETILQAALDRDIDVPYSCMGGACSSCRAKLLEGEVDMDCNLILTEEETEEGYILVCQARPTTEKVVVDFDNQ